MIQSLKSKQTACIIQPQRQSPWGQQQLLHSVAFSKITTRGAATTTKAAAAAAVSASSITKCYKYNYSAKSRRNSLVIAPRLCRLCNRWKLCYKTATPPAHTHTAGDGQHNKTRLNESNNNYNSYGNKSLRQSVEN